MSRATGIHLSTKAGFIIFLITLMVSISLGATLHLIRTYHTGLATHQVLAAI
jgi:hypothetical protein